MTSPMTARRLAIATTAAALSFAALRGHADTAPDIVVEASAPVQNASTGQGSPGGASVDLLSVRYHISVGSLDLTKHADVVALEQKVREAARKGCKEIRRQYPLAHLSDEDTCVNDALRTAMVKVQAAIAAAAAK
jgi:UrcA family protein